MEAPPSKKGASVDEEQDQALDPTARETALASLLRQHPRALVSAIDGDGLFVDLPPGVVEDDRRVVAARTALELVESAAPSSAPGSR
jgi:hypothetical protein